MENKELFSVIFFLLSYLSLISLLLFVFSDINKLLLIILGVILFFIVLGISAGIYDFLSNEEEYEHNIQREYIKSPNYTKRLKNTYNKNKKKKYRNRYHKKRVSKMHRHHKGLISKKEYYKKKDSCAAISYGGWYLFPP